MSNLLDAMHRAETLDEKRRKFVSTLRAVHQYGRDNYQYVQVGCIIGPINEQVMRSWQRRLWCTVNHPVLTLIDVVPAMMNGLGGTTAARHFWVNTLESGYITDLFVIPESNEDPLTRELLLVASRNNIHITRLSK